MRKKSEQRREQVETALSNLGTMRIEMPLVRKRVEQTVERWPAAERFLSPLAGKDGYLTRWEDSLGRVMEILHDEWLSGNQNGWNEEEDR
jgi:hypothetical protein